MFVLDLLSSVSHGFDKGCLIKMNVEKYTGLSTKAFVVVIALIIVVPILVTYVRGKAKV